LLSISQKITINFAAIKAYVVSSEPIATGSENDDWIKATVDVLEVFKSGRRSPSSTGRIRRGAQLVVWIPTTPATPDTAASGRQRRRQLQFMKQQRQSGSSSTSSNGGRCQRCPDLQPRRTYFLAGRTDDGEDDDGGNLADALGSSAGSSVVIDRSSSIVARWNSDVARAVREVAGNERRVGLSRKMYHVAGCR
jgi:hypothetical protein